MKTKILVTGANGFLGSRLIKELLKRRGIFVYGTYRKKTGRLLRKNRSNLVNLRCDLSREKKVLAIFRKYRFDLVIHTAASISTKNDFRYLLEALRDNVMSQINLTSAAIKYNCKRFIYCSSISVYASQLERKIKSLAENDVVRPQTIYGWSKYVSEEILRIATQSQSIMKGITLRMAGIYGPGRESGAVYSMVTSALSKKPITINEPESRFRFLFVDDAAQAVLLAFSSSPATPYTCYNVGGREIFRLEELAKQIFDITGCSGGIKYNKGEKVRNRALNIRKIQTGLGFRPKTLRENIKIMVDEIKNKTNYYGSDGHE